jgi:hypothetical protein
MFTRSITRHSLLSSCAFAAPAEAGSAKPSVPAAGKSPFAHLARSKPNAAEDDKDDKKDKKDASEKDEGEEDDEEDEDKKSKKSKKAKKAADDDEDDSEDASAEEDDENCEEDEDDKKKSKKSKKAADDGDDDSDREDEDDTEARKARGRERGRIRAIVLSSAGKLNPVGAMELACGTSMPRRQAIGVLQAMGAPAASSPRQTDALRNRMSGVETPEIGSGDARPDANASPAKATAEAIIAAGKKRRGEK